MTSGTIKSKQEKRDPKMEALFERIDSLISPCSVDFNHEHLFSSKMSLTDTGDLGIQTEDLESFGENPEVSSEECFDWEVKYELLQVLQEQLEHELRMSRIREQSTNEINEQLKKALRNSVQENEEHVRDMLNLIERCESLQNKNKELKNENKSLQHAHIKVQNSITDLIQQVEDKTIEWERLFDTRQHQWEKQREKLLNKNEYLRERLLRLNNEKSQSTLQDEGVCCIKDSVDDIVEKMQVRKILRKHCQAERADRNHILTKTHSTWSHQDTPSCTSFSVTQKPHWNADTAAYTRNSKTSSRNSKDSHTKTNRHLQAINKTSRRSSAPDKTLDSKAKTNRHQKQVPTSRNASPFRFSTPSRDRHLGLYDAIRGDHPYAREKDGYCKIDLEETLSISGTSIVNDYLESQDKPSAGKPESMIIQDSLIRHLLSRSHALENTDASNSYSSSAMQLSRSTLRKYDKMKQTNKHISDQELPTFKVTERKRNGPESENFQN